MSRKAGDGNNGALVEMNVTPLIDVLLVLIITFMVVTNTRPTGLDASVPRPAKGPSNETKIVVSVDPNRGIEINGAPITTGEFAARLREIFKSRSERVIFLDADPQLAFGEVARVMDQAKGAGITTIGLMAARGQPE